MSKVLVWNAKNIDNVHSDIEDIKYNTDDTEVTRCNCCNTIISVTRHTNEEKEQINKALGKLGLTTEDELQILVNIAFNLSDDCVTETVGDESDLQSDDIDFSFTDKVLINTDYVLGRLQEIYNAKGMRLNERTELRVGGMVREYISGLIAKKIIEHDNFVRNLHTKFDAECIDGINAIFKNRKQIR